MLDLCLTNDANIVAKGFKIGVEREPTNDEKYAKVYEKKKQTHMSKKCRKTCQNPGNPAPKSSLTLLISRYTRVFRANGSPGLCQSRVRDIYIHTNIYIYIYIYEYKYI